MEIKKFSVTTHHVKALVYGASGSGKTTFAGTARNAIFASAEGGLMSISDKTPDFVEIRSLKDLMDLHAYLRNEKHGYETVVIDSISEINEIIKIEIERRTGKSMQLQDWGELAKRIRGILRGFRDLPMHVLFIAQESTETDEQKIVKFVPQLNGKAATEVAYFMDIVGYLKIEPDGSRHMICEPNAKYLTKDRSRVIGNDSPVDFGVWMDKIATLEIGEQTVKTKYNGPKKKPTKQQGMEFLTAAKQIEQLQTIYDQLFTYEWKPEEAADLSETYVNCFKKLSPKMLFNGQNQVFDGEGTVVGTFVTQPNGKIVLEKPAENPEEKAMAEAEREGMKAA